MGADYQTLHQLDRARRERWREEAHRRFRDEPRDDDLLAAVAHHEASRAREKALAERCARAEQRVRDLEEAQGELLGLLDFYEKTIWVLEDQLDHERRTNTALRLEIGRWRANDEGRAVRLREALELYMLISGGIPPYTEPWPGRSIISDALAADREGR